MIITINPSVTVQVVIYRLLDPKTLVETFEIGSFKVFLILQC